MRSIKKIHSAEYRPVADLVTYSPMPTRQLEMIDPFLFLNHHGPQTYGPLNNGLPFGPHPHRGMETVTFIIDGDIAHKDSDGNESVIYSGGVQWMTAGSGLIHAEISSEDFKKFGGDLEILQLWVNLPASLKMTKPKYIGLQEDKIPVISLDEGKVKTKIVSGKFEDHDAAFETITDVNLRTFSIKKSGILNLDIPKENNILFYVIRGEVKVNDVTVTDRQLVEFENDATELKIEASEDSLLLFGDAKPFNEPVVARGPFVMNSLEEIDQAYADFQAGKLGNWNG